MSEVQPGHVIAGKYRLIQRISGGGMGSVWLAEHGQLDAPVAVKFMHGSLLDVQGARARFEREAKAAAQIRSPYVVHVYDHGIDGETGTPFIVMEYLEGQDLGTRLKRGQRLELREAVRICDQVCKGLYRAHKLGIVHRDLKPGNIFLSEADDQMVKLLDFGIAKETGNKRVVRGETTTTGQVLGSPHYMSPEQARGRQLDGRSDLWSLAVIMYRAITGKRPFDGDDMGDLIVRICTDPVPPASHVNITLGPAVDAFFDRAFSREPSARFQTAKAFAAEFKAAVLGIPVPLDADASQPIPALAEPSASWESHGSGSFSSRALDIDDEAPTLATPSLLEVPYRGTPVDASHTLGVGGQRKRRVLLWVSLAMLALLGGAAAAYALMPLTGFEQHAAAPVAAASETSAPTAASSSVQQEDEEEAAPSASAVPTTEPTPLTKPVPRPHVARPKPKPQPTAKPGSDPDLGY
ncbi:MAG TPA: protein kinase [Polyangiaceae bacterium]|nr:protein kinase [Polyangiaceae bacterium]